MLKEDFGLKITPQSLQRFYKKNDVGFLAVGYIYK
jgi:hypothetical protein